MVSLHMVVFDLEICSFISSSAFLEYTMTNIQDFISIKIVDFVPSSEIR